MYVGKYTSPMDPSWGIAYNCCCQNFLARLGVLDESKPKLKHQTSNEKKGPWLFRVYGGWDTTQSYRDYNKPI